MPSEVLLNLFVYAFFEKVDNTYGSLHFDGSPGVEYDNTIVFSAVDSMLWQLVLFQSKVSIVM